MFLGSTPAIAAAIAGRAGVELVAGIDVPDAVLLDGQGVHRLHRRVDIEACQILRLDHLRGLFHRGGGVAVLDEQDAFSPLLLQAARLVDDRLVGDVGIGSFVPIDLQRRGRLLGAFIAGRDRDHPAGRRGRLVVDDDGFDEARNLLGCAVVDRFYRRAVAHRRDRELAVKHAGHEGVDAVFAGAVRLRRNVELRQRLADLRVLVGRLQLDRLELVRRPGLVRLAALHDLGICHALLRLRMMRRASSRAAVRFPARPSFQQPP